MRSNDFHQYYDVIVIGSGFGGSFVGYSLAKAGFKTLLLEKGNWAKRDELDWSSHEIFVNRRYKSSSPLLLKQNNDFKIKKTYPTEAVGGKSIIYGGASLRMREVDFERWPISYATLEPFYTQVEKILEIYGDVRDDPCNPPRSEECLCKAISLTEPAQRIFLASKELGYQPFKLPMAINFANHSRPTCILCNKCDGFPCKIEAKNDLAATVLRKAEGHDLEIMTDVIGERIIEKNGEIISIVCINKSTKERFSLRSKIVIVSGGAIQSSALLLRSNLQKYQNHNFLGRYLMRHCNAVVCALFPFQTNPKKLFHKQVCVTHFYNDLRNQFNTSVGVIQDIYTPSPNTFKRIAPLGTKKLVAAVSSYTQNLLCIAEDDPNINNRVTLSNEKDDYDLQKIKVEHRYGKNDYFRRNYLIKKAKKILTKAGGLLFYIHEIDTLSHAMGTIRFGTNPDRSVLNKNCQFFGIKNLFVVDSSFLPTSSGVNPSLTIAANALRVAEFIKSNFYLLTSRSMAEPQEHYEHLPAS